MKIILTGAAGFIGSCYLTHLNARGITNVVVVDTEPNPSSYPTLKNKKYASYLSREALLDALSGSSLADVDGVVHMGACSDTTMMDRAFLTRNNLEYSQRLAEWCWKGDKFFHYASSASVYGDGKLGYSDDDMQLEKFKPLNPYAESKWQFDRWLIQNNKTRAVVGFRYFNVFGPNEYHKASMRSIVCKAFEQIKAGRNPTLFASSRDGYADGSELRDFVYVKDICDMMSFFLDHPDKKGIFNLGTGQARSFKELVEAVFLALGKKPQIDFIPMPASLRGQYQYYTQAEMGKLKQIGYTKSLGDLEKSVADYVHAHLEKNFSIY